MQSIVILGTGGTIAGQAARADDGVGYRAGALGVQAVIKDAGYETKRGPTGAVGFFHGTGHGLGMEVHELPRPSTVPRPLRTGAVVTVEPGLYYPGLGGCRWEDVVQVTPTGCRKLSHHPYAWEIR